MLDLLHLALSDVLAPRSCAACDARLARFSVFCPPCASTVVAEPPPDAAQLRFSAYGPYGGALATAIRRLKYDDRPDLAEPLASLLERSVRSAGLEGWVTAVPLHPRRLAERRYNQAALLGAVLARSLGRPFRPRALERVHAGPPQAERSRRERLSLPAGTFRAVPFRPRAGPFRAVPDASGTSSSPDKVLLVDDVVTTGATARAAVEALRELRLDVTVVALAWAERT